MEQIKKTHNKTNVEKEIKHCKWTVYEKNPMLDFWSGMERVFIPFPGFFFCFLKGQIREKSSII